MMGDPDVILTHYRGFLGEAEDDNTLREIVSVREVPAGKYTRRFGAAIYRAVPRKSDGVETYRFIRAVSRPRGSRNEAIQDAIWYARENDIRYVQGISHGQRVDAVEEVVA